MRNTFTKTFIDLQETAVDNQNKEKIEFEPDKEVLAFISQFAKVYHVEKRLKKYGFAIPLILN